MTLIEKYKIQFVDGPVNIHSTYGSAIYFILFGFIIRVLPIKQSVIDNLISENQAPNTILLLLLFVSTTLLIHSFFYAPYTNRKTMLLTCLVSYPANALLSLLTALFGLSIGNDLYHLYQNITYNTSNNFNIELIELELLVIVLSPIIINCIMFTDTFIKYSPLVKPSILKFFIALIYFALVPNYILYLLSIIETSK